MRLELPTNRLFLPTLTVRVKDSLFGGLRTGRFNDTHPNRRRLARTAPASGNCGLAANSRTLALHQTRLSYG